MEYEPFDYLKAQYESEKAEGLMELIYNSPHWIEADRGVYSISELYKIFSEKRPEWADDIRSLLSRETIMSIMTPKIDTVEFLNELKASGYKIYLLSNFSKENFAWVDEAYAFLREVDGRVISSHVKLIKPDPRIFELILKRYGLEACESVFIDDIPANVRAAEDLGIYTIQFTDIANLRKEFFLLRD